MVVGAIDQDAAHAHLAHLAEGDLGRAPSSGRARTWCPASPAVLERELGFTVAQRAAAFDADHLHLPGVCRRRLDALDHIFRFAVRAPEWLSHRLELPERNRENQNRHCTKHDHSAGVHKLAFHGPHAKPLLWNLVSKNAAGDRPAAQ